MASKAATTKRERIGRVDQRRLVASTQRNDGVLVKPKRVVDPNDVLTPEESALVKKAEREMRQGKYVTLDKLRHDLGRPRSRRSRKTA